MDKFTLEVFANDGEQAMTSLIYTPLCARDIRFPAMDQLKFLWLCMNWYRGFLITDRFFLFTFLIKNKIIIMIILHK